MACVAGAFHTVHMEPAVARLAAVASELTLADPVCAVLTNADGSVVADGTVAVERLVNQVANPVRWDLCMETLAARGVTGLLELAHADARAALERNPGRTGPEGEALRALLYLFRKDLAIPLIRAG